MLHAEWAPALRILLALHILNGIVALICAPIALATAKGGRAHRRWGKIYFWAMAVVAVTALALGGSGFRFFAIIRVLLACKIRTERQLLTCPPPPSSAAVLQCAGSSLILKSDDVRRDALGNQAACHLRRKLSKALITL